MNTYGLSVAILIVSSSIVLGQAALAADTTTPQSKDPQAACQALSQTQVPASKFSLATSGAVVTNATLVNAGDAEIGRAHV